MCSYEAMHLVMLTASVIKWQVETLDFTSAFQLGDILGSEVFLRPTLNVCPVFNTKKLKKCIDALNDIPSSWYKRMYHELTHLKETVSAYYNALFLWHDTTGNMMAILAMHVEYFIFCGNDTF